MKSGHKPDNEPERQGELDSFKIIDSEEKADFDFLTQMAAEICGTPIALISFITKERQWFLSHRGLTAHETPRDVAFCAHAILKPDEIFEIEDARKDDRFFDNPLVSGEPNVVFYAGVPLVSNNGFPLGTLCAIDREPKKLSEQQRNALKGLARQTIQLLELRRQTINLGEVNKSLQKVEFLLNESHKSNKTGAWELDIETGKTLWTEGVYQIHEVSTDFPREKSNGLDFYHPDDLVIIVSALESTIQTGDPFDVTCRIKTAKQNDRWVRVQGKVFEGNENKKTIVGTFQDVTEHLLSEKIKARQNFILSIVNKLQQTFISESNIAEVFDSALSILLDLTGSEYGFIGQVLYDSSGNPYLKTHAITNIAWNEETRNFFKENAPNGLEFRNLKTLFGVVLKEGRAVIANHPASDPRSGGLPAGHPPLNAFLGIPIYVNNKMIGMAGVSNRVGGYDTELITEIELVTGTIGRLIEAQQARLLINHIQMRHQYTLEGTNVGTWEWNVQTGETVFNERWAEIVGYSLAELGQVNVETWQKLVHPEDLAESKKRLNLVFEKKADYYSIETRIRHKEGHYVWVYDRGKVFSWTKEGKPLMMYGTHQDITENKEREAKLAAVSREIRNITNAVNESSLISITDRAGIITHANKLFSELSGYSEQELVGNTHKIINSGFHDKAFWENLWQTIKNGNVWKGEVKNRAKDGSEYWVSSVISPIFDENGQIFQYLSIRQDITTRKRFEEELKTLSLTDPLTGVGNRRFFMNLLDREWQRFRRFKQPTSILMLDIDFFKKINDTYGHATGDEVLSHTGELLNKLRATDVVGVYSQSEVVGRIGGEEFAIIATNTALPEAKILAERLRKDIASLHIEKAGVLIPVTASFGAAAFSENDSGPESAMQYADQALYKAKQNGRNRVVIYSKNSFLE
ncbi:MAG: diguanylate cyclase [Leptospiraceae bacterium]|nr:diguanylate cyclase [Leptospiraceae bacterium]MBL0262939.1 diguanylate cyclase [Leptospiraceae bacterium]